VAKAVFATDSAATGSPNGERALLSVHGVSKRFGGVTAVEEISFTVAPGESVGLVGPNGAGKTTLFNCITGNLRCDGGAVEFDGQPMRGVASYRRARMGIGRTFQRVEVFPEISVREHLLAAHRGRRGEGGILRDLCNLSKPTTGELAKVDELMELVGISREADTPVAALGLGLCRLVELARALATEPKLLMADEPSSGLDVRETAELAKVLRTVQRDRGMAVLLVEHDLRMVADVVDRTLVMDLGCLISHGTFDEVMADPAVRRAYLGLSS
jgi:branched-chain amino acid transport system ATP-binding protein